MRVTAYIALRSFYAALKRSYSVGLQHTRALTATVLVCCRNTIVIRFVTFAVGSAVRDTVVHEYFFNSV